VNDTGNVRDIERFERKIFNIPFMKPYKFKYYLLTHFPALHDKAVKWKAKLKT
jgi:hypothetical protein